ncbi:outer membrane beta-barrel domain protein [Neorickettsia helminthoeca str. Oregon]|uniref:Outer membrane beta-barrel domain protein n=1 Tax=Neorickettsia helminthoeca str. Oregon TaxID=1286528 RepID=X5H4X3_9RICK|nr:P44/Msp2 family outer membrane protein [Neorickettsia helminthoeca]AHX11753.1 outer membrane beta-barrel domain protein [Neorickettsia helminthoeca str. Oregon]
MINKKFLISVALAGVLCLASTSDAQDALEDADIFYAKVGYNATKMQPVEWTKARVSGDTSKFKPEYESSFIGGSAALGYYFGGMRVELEGSMYNVDSKKGSKIPETKQPDAPAIKYGGACFMGGMLSVNYDVALTDYISPYFGVGFGLSRVSLKLDDDALSTAYHMSSQLKGGVSITGLAAVVPYAGYKFTYMNDKGYSKVALANSTELAPQLSHMVHNFEAGLMLPMNA